MPSAISAKRALALLAVAIAVSACGGSSLSPSASTTPVPTVAATPAVPLVPADYSDWVALQGFGGGSGLDGLSKAPRFLREHLGDPGGDLGHWARIADGLVRWLDGHSPTDCWAAYHAAIRPPLVTIRDDLAEMVSLAEAGSGLTLNGVDELEADVAAAMAVPPPTTC